MGDFGDSGGESTSDDDEPGISRQYFDPLKYGRKTRPIETAYEWIIRDYLCK